MLCCAKGIPATDMLYRAGELVNNLIGFNIKLLIFRIYLFSILKKLLNNLLVSPDPLGMGTGV